MQRCPHQTFNDFCLLILIMLDQYFCREDQGPQKFLLVLFIICYVSVLLYISFFLSFFQAKRLKRRCNVCEFCKVPECRVSWLRWLTRVLYSFFLIGQITVLVSVLEPR
jgi:hypothetical protein